MAETKETSATDEILAEEKPPTKSWMVRPCVLYKEEYKDCKSFRGRFQQYFVDGKLEDCSSWSQDYINCEKWKNEKNIKAFNEIIVNEETRREKRLNAHYSNKVWENRLQPPENWNSPLPEWMQKRQENSYLSRKSKELKEGGTLDEKSVCVIL